MTADLADNMETTQETDDGASTSIGLAIADEPVLLPSTPGQPAPSLPTRPANYSASDNTAGSVPSSTSTSTRPIDNHYIESPASNRNSRINSSSNLDSKKDKPAILEGDEKGISRTDSRYSRLNRSLLLCAIAVALSSINYGWVIGSVNIPALVIEECSDGPETWTSGFPSCIPMSSIMWGL
ncbi:Bifunctional purine biosynthesis protein PurH, partial [Coemansia sp. S17]